MSDDVPVFRSDAPHQVAVPQDGGNAVSPSPHVPDGPARQIADSVVFAPLDEPRQLDEIEIPPDQSDSRPISDIPAADQFKSPDEGVLDQETASEREKRIRRLSPDLVARALEIRQETESISTSVDRLIASLPGFPSTDTNSSDVSLDEGESGSGAVVSKESS